MATIIIITKGENMATNKFIYILILIIISYITIFSSFVSASTTVTDTSIETTGNITIGQKIIFAFGEILDNIVDGWLKITGNLNVTGNATISGTSLQVNNTQVCLVDGTNCQLSPMGEVSVTNNSVITVITAANTWTLVNASWAGNPNNMMFLNYTNGTIQYNGNNTMFFHIAMTLSVKGEGGNDVMRASIFKNGVLLSGGQIQQKLAGGAGDVGSTAIHIATTLSTNDTLNVYLLNENDADDFTVTYANLFAMGMRMG